MSNPKFYSSSLNVLSRLICPEGSAVVVYDPERLLIRDESFCFTYEKSFLSLLRRLDLTDPACTCLFNLSTKEMAVASSAWVVEFKAGHAYNGMERVQWSSINNPDGTTRWVYPSRLRIPRFLAFYNFSYWKARLYKFLVKTAFLVRLPGLIPKGRIVVHHRLPVQVEMLTEASGRDYAVFTGTAGPNRKIIIAEGANGGKGETRSFLKIALNQRSAANINNEYEALCRLRSLPMEGILVPDVSKIDEGTIRVSNVKPVLIRKDRTFGAAHARFLRKMMDASFEKEYYCDLKITAEVHHRLQQLAAHPRLCERGRAQELFDKLVVLEKNLRADNPLIGVCMSHGDFTPWNVYSSGDTLMVYDWELYRQTMPVLFDLFQYVVQGNVFAVNASVSQLRSQLNSVLQSPVPARIVQEKGLDPELYLKLYLLIHASYYLEVYLSQEVLHEMGYRLFSVWSDLLAGTPVEIPPTAGTKDGIRRKFLGCFFKFLEPRNYTVLKSAGKSMQDLALGSDLDLLISIEDRNTALDWIRHYPGVKKLRCTKRSFMTTVQLFFADQSFLSIDLLTAFHRKSLEYITAGTLLDSAETMEGVRQLPPAYDYLYIYLFYQLNSSPVPPRYTKWFDGLTPAKERDVLVVLEEEAGIRAEKLSDTFGRSAQQRRVITKFLRGRYANTLFGRLVRWLRYGYDQCSDLFRAGGIMVTFSGVDGAGKSTILGDVRELLEKKYRRKVVVLRHRPSLLPILSAWKYGKEAAEQRCVASLPRKGKNKSLFSSALRFAYYYFDYLVGQFIIYIKYTLRGYVILYDRYYFDFVVDGRRSNIGISPRFIRQLYRFIFKPQLNVFLYAAPEVILERKQELSAGDIVRLTSGYKKLFGRLGSQQRYICIENRDKQATINQIEQAYIQLNK